MPKGKSMLGKFNSGQSLIETIVAIGIIVTAIVAILSVGLTDVILGGQSGERVIAINLAREGIEVIYAIRNSNRLDPDQSWPYGLSNGDWRINYSTTNLTGNEAAFSGGGSTIEDCTNCYLCQQENDTYVTCEQQEIFYRMVTISAGDVLGGNCPIDCEKQIVSTIYWQERGRPHTVSLETRLTDWR